MAQKHTALSTGQTVELADKDTSFFDPKTGFKVVRDATETIGKTIGEKTNLAVASGRLLIVESKTKSESKSKENTGSDLPEDLPGRKEFLAAGLNFEQVKNLKSDEELLAVKGIGAKTVEELKDWADKNAE